MKLLSLRLLHYRRFRQEEIIFKDDFSLIFGRNGAGKSSILDAIGYALFGPGGKDFVRVNREFLKSYFVTDKKPSKIELNFQYGMGSYRIVRVIDAGIKKFASDFIKENKDTLFGPNGLEIIGGDEVTNYITKLLGVDKETFLRSVFAKQKDLEVLSGLLSDRKELINKILGLDRIENIVKNFKDEEKEKRTLLEMYKKRVSDFDEEGVKKERKEILKKKLELEKIFKLKQKELETLNKDFLKVKGDFDKEDKKRTEFLGISSQIDSLKKRKEFFIKQNEKNISELALLKEKIKTLEKKFGEDFFKKMNQEQENLDKLIQAREKILEQKVDLESRLDSLRSEIKELQSELQELQKLKDKANCPTCKRPLGNHFLKLNEILKGKIEEKIKSGLELKSGKLDKVSKELESLEKRILDARLFLESLKNEEKEFIKSSENKSNLEKSILQNTSNLKEIEKELLVLEENLKNLDYDEKSYERVKQDFYKINSDINSKQKELDHLRQDILNFDFKLKNLDEKILEFENDKKLVQEYIIKIDNLALKRQIMSDYIMYLLKHLKPRIEDLASEYFSIITDGKYAEILLDDDYNILIDGKDLDLYSGGERDLANLCLRLSLGQNLTGARGNPINFLILDEVLASQDRERQQNILISLKKLENKFSQIILISHLEEIKDLATNLIEIKAINKDESIVVYHC